MGLFAKQTHRLRKQTYGSQRGKRRQRNKFGVLVNIYILLYIKYFNNKGLLYSKGNSILYLLITYNGKRSEKEYLYGVYVQQTESLCCPPETNVTL